MNRGYTKSYRKELASDIWNMPPIYHRVWFYLRQKASYEHKKFPCRDGSFLDVQPGQIITSIGIIADEISWTEWGKKKTPNKKIIHDILGWLEGNDMVTVESNAKGTMVTIINWPIYNSQQDIESNDSETAGGNTSYPLLKNIKEVKEIKKKNIKKKKGANLTDPPQNIEISESIKKHAKKIGFTKPIQPFIDYFLDKCRGNGTQQKDWEATLRTWMTNDVSWHPEKHKQIKKMSDAELTKKKLDKQLGNA